jgi:hypothetical protein
MQQGEKRKVVSFNLELDTERRLFEVANRMNFSGFVKRALLARVAGQPEVDEEGWTSLQVDTRADHD